MPKNKHPTITIELTGTALIDETRKYLDSQRGSWPEIELATGLSRYWISRVVCGVIEGPDSRKCERILIYKLQQEERERAIAAKTGGQAPGSRPRKKQNVRAA